MNEELPAEIHERFQVGDEVAVGRTGVLHRAVEVETGIEGALKVMHTHVSSPRERMRLTRDLARQAGLANPHLSVPIATGEAGERIWLFRPWVEGESLRARLDRDGAMDQGAALAVAGQVAAALDELHRSGLLHRDVKPGHIILDETGSVVLIDSGVVSPIPTGSLFEVLGTPAYVSPEMANGKVVSFRSDLYSLGCTLHEALTGEPIFDGDDLAAVVQAHVDLDPPAPPADLPERVVSLLEALLAKNPRERPFSANNVSKILRPFVPTDLRTRPSSIGVSGFASTLPGTGAAPSPEPARPPTSESERPTKVASLPPPPPPEAGPRPRASAPPPPIPTPAQGSTERADATIPLSDSQLISAQRADPTEPVALHQIIDAEEGRAKPSIPPPTPEGVQPRDTLAEEERATAPAIQAAPARPMPIARPRVVVDARGGKRRWPLAVAALVALFSLSFWMLSGDDPEETHASAAPTPSTPATAAAVEAAPPPVEVTPEVVAAPEAEVAPEEEAPEAEVAPEASEAESTSTQAAGPSAFQRAKRQAARHFEARRYAQAEVAYRRATRLNSRDAASWVGLGASRIRQGNPRGAVDPYKRATRLRPRNSNYFAFLGRAYQRSGNSRLARQAYRRALSLNSGNRIARSGLSSL